MLALAGISWRKKSVETPEIFQKNKTLFVIGISIFVSDFIFGWSSFLLGWIPMIFVLGFIIGILAGNTDNGIGVFGLTLVIGNLIGVVILAIVLAPSWLSGGFNFVSFAILFFIAPFYAMNPYISVLTLFGPSENFMVYFILAPGFYVLSFVFFVIGGTIGNYRRDETETTLLRLHGRQASPPDLWPSAPILFCRGTRRQYRYNR